MCEKSFEISLFLSPESVLINMGNVYYERMKERINDQIMKLVIVRVGHF